MPGTETIIAAHSNIVWYILKKMDTNWYNQTGGGQDAKVTKAEVHERV